MHELQEKAVAAGNHPCPYCLFRPAFLERFADQQRTVFYCEAYCRRRGFVTDDGQIRFEAGPNPSPLAAPPADTERLAELERWWATVDSDDEQIDARYEALAAKWLVEQAEYPVATDPRAEAAAAAVRLCARELGAVRTGAGG